MNEKIDGKPMKYSVFVIYSEKRKEFFAKNIYYRATFTADATKARMYTRKSNATNSLNQSNLKTDEYGFAVYERKISASDYKCLTVEDKDKKIRELELELDRLRAEIDVVKRRNAGGLTAEQLNEKLRPIMPFHPDRFGPPYT